jgi:hypothetical protein
MFRVNTVLSTFNATQDPPYRVTLIMFIRDHDDFLDIKTDFINCHDIAIQEADHSRWLLEGIRRVDLIGASEIQVDCERAKLTHDKRAMANVWELSMWS